MIGTLVEIFRRGFFVFLLAASVFYGCFVIVFFIVVAIFIFWAA
jgi:hypothetical protein